MSQSARVFLVFVISWILLLVGATGVPAQTPASPQTQKVVERTVTIDAQGNTVVTERTFISGKLVKEEITVTSPQGVVVGKMEISYDPASGQIIKREIKVQTDSIPPSIREALSSIGIAVPQGVSVKVEEKRGNGQTVAVEVTFVQNGVKVEQEYKLVNGQLTLVKEEREDEEEHRAKGDEQRIESKGSKPSSEVRNEGSGTETRGQDSEERSKREEDHEEHEKSGED